MSEELFDIVNENDRVIGQETRSVVHQRGLWHRGVHVLLFSAGDKLLVQQRSRNKSQSPLMFDCSVSEHVRAGENYYDAAIRGLSEELGVEGIEIQPLIKFKMNYGPNDNEISTIYKGSFHQEQINFDPVEIERVDFYTLHELQEMLKQTPGVFSYWFMQILKWQLGETSDLQILDIDRRQIPKRKTSL